MELKKTEIQKLLEQSLESFGKSQDQVCMTIDEIDSLINQFEGDTTGLDLDGKLLYLQNQGTWSSTCDRILTPKDIILEDTIISSTMQDLDVLVTELETFIASVLMQKGAPTLENVKCTSFKENIKVQVRWTPCDRAQTYNIRLLSTLPDGRPEERVIRHLTDKESTGYDISFLRPDTTYHVAVASVYSGCESKYCEAVTLTTTLTEKDQLTSPPQISDLYEIISNTDTATIGLLLAGCTEGETYCIRLTAADNESVKYDFSYKIIFDKRPEWSISGLKYSTTYNVSVAAVSLHVGYSLSAPVSITTGKQVLCPEFHLDPEDHHPGVMLDFPHASVADKECSRNLIDASVPNIWSNVRGVAANINLVDDANQYWEVRVKYDIISTLDDYDILADIGICETTKRDLFSPTSQNDHSLCCSIIKQGRVPYVVLKYWDGTKRRTSTECSVLFPLSRRVTTVFKLGFYLDFDHRVMKLVHVDNNRLLHVFTDLSIQDVLPMCELYNAEKVAITLKFITGSEVKTIPSVIRESAPT